VMMLVFPVIGLIWVLIGHYVHGGTATIFAILTVILTFVIAIATTMMFNYRIRSRVLRVVNGAWHFITRRSIEQFITELDNALNNGVTALRNNRPAFIYLMVLMTAYWALAAAALWFCFFALGRSPNIGILFCGFGIGIVAGNLSLIPGGLGVQEASLAGVFALLGTPFAEAALASILFRVVYDFIPFFLSLLLYSRLIRKRTKTV
ncbi:MAG: flippase-like domain-containing protein, partial [Sedimentisphaerales bacterium]